MESPRARDKTLDENKDRGDGSHIGRLHELMQWRADKILLVSSLYDSFMLSEDRFVDELVFGEELGVDLYNMPDLRRVSTGAEALALVERGGWDLVISSPLIGDMDAGTLARRVRQLSVDSAGPTRSVGSTPPSGLRRSGRSGRRLSEEPPPVILLSYHDRELHSFLSDYDATGIDRTFLFQGDARLLLAIVKYVEDLKNVAHDVKTVGVQVILVVEDSIRYYSSFLPTIYTEVMQQTRALVPGGVNLAHKLLRIKARPKILLCNNYEEAWDTFKRYEHQMLGVISDVEFPKNGEKCFDAGLQLAAAIRACDPDISLLLHSGQPANRERAAEVGVPFLRKGSPRLLRDLREFMLRHFGFGDFVFKTPDGAVVTRASNLKRVEQALHTVPDESLIHHASYNHFSRWLKAHTEFAIAERMRRRRLTDFADAADLRAYLIDAIRDHRRARRRAVVADFDSEHFDSENSFARIGGGSLGGKARGLAFANLLLTKYELEDRFEDVRIAVPPTIVIGTDVFDEFLESNGLRDMAMTIDADDRIISAFAQASFPLSVHEQLRDFLRACRYPLAVRSSSLLEDSKYQPFAGIYDTLMIPNARGGVDLRLEQLTLAIKRIYASTFLQRTKRHLASTSYRLEEEKMAVILQRIVGSPHGANGERFYPEISGVAMSQNFYPVDPIGPNDGLAAVALGLGVSVVEGEHCLRFSPRHPQRLVQMSSVKDTLQNSQREFYALQLDVSAADYASGLLRRFDLRTAEADGTLVWSGSTYSAENDVIYDGVSRPGVRLVNFAPILKYGLFPLPEILDALLAIGVEAAGGPVEIEFAASLKSEPAGSPKEFAFLQLRPVAQPADLTSTELGEVDPTALVCTSTSVLGNGRIDDVRDVVVVAPDSYERGDSRLVANDVARFNGELVSLERPYLLIGVGRWGSSDALLGIPVAWGQIAGARAIVEAGFRDFMVTPSQGTHFFQNLVANNVGYFTVNPQAGEGSVDWDWIADQPAVASTQYVRHLRFAEPLPILMNGARNEGVILKPGA